MIDTRHQLSRLTQVWMLAECKAMADDTLETQMKALHKSLSTLPPEDYASDKLMTWSFEATDLDLLKTRLANITETEKFLSLKEQLKKEGKISDGYTLPWVSFQWELESAKLSIASRIKYLEDKLTDEATCRQQEEESKKQDALYLKDLEDKVSKGDQEASREIAIYAAKMDDLDYMQKLASSGNKFALRAVERQEKGLPLIPGPFDDDLDGDFFYPSDFSGASSKYLGSSLSSSSSSLSSSSSSSLSSSSSFSASSSSSK